MKEKEMHILSHLRKDARTSLAAISYSIQMPISTIYDKINRWNKGKIIKRFTTLVDFPRLGFHYHAKLALRVPKEKKKELSTFLQQHSSLNSLHEINNGFDFFLETVHKDVKEYVEFVEELKQYDVFDLQEYQVINELAREKFL